MDLILKRLMVKPMSILDLSPPDLSYLFLNDVFHFRKFGCGKIFADSVIVTECNFAGLIQPELTIMIIQSNNIYYIHRKKLILIL